MNFMIRPPFLFHFMGYSNMTCEIEQITLNCKIKKTSLCPMPLDTQMQHLKLIGKDIQKKAQTEFVVYVQAAPLMLIWMVLNIELIKFKTKLTSTTWQYLKYFKTHIRRKYSGMARHWENIQAQVGTTRTSSLPPGKTLGGGLMLTSRQRINV